MQHHRHFAARSCPGVYSRPPGRRPTGFCTPVLRGSDPIARVTKDDGEEENNLGQGKLPRQQAASTPTARFRPQRSYRFGIAIFAAFRIELQIL